MGPVIILNNDAVSGRIAGLDFHNRDIHRYLSTVDKSSRVDAALGALSLGCQAILMSSSLVRHDHVRICARIVDSRRRGADPPSRNAQRGRHLYRAEGRVTCDGRESTSPVMLDRRDLCGLLRRMREIGDRASASKL